MRPSNASVGVRYFCVKCGNPDAECACSAMYAWRWDGDLQPVTEDGRVYRDVLAAAHNTETERPS